MKLSELRETYYEYSGKLSDVGRQLNFAGIAVVWIFRIGENTGGIPFASCLLWSLKFFVLSLGLDLLHYTYATIAWSSIHTYREKKEHTEDDDKKAPSWINWLSLLFFWTKITAVISGYAILISYLWDKL